MAGWLRDHGWRPKVQRLADVAASYGRPVPGPSAGGFLSASRHPGDAAAEPPAG